MSKVYSPSVVHCILCLSVARLTHCFILICNSKVDAINYYSEEEQVLYDACEEGKAQAFQKPLGIAFVSFQTDMQAAR